MKVSVFLSWSGEKSNKVATLLRDWLPLVHQAIEPFVSDKDIGKGTRWSPEIAAKLESCGFGILCLTPENRDAPWILFEAGALSKIVKDNVVPLLVGLSKSDITFPLAQFQAVSPTREEMYDLMATINGKAGDATLEAARLKKAFDAFWPQFEKDFREIENFTEKRPAKEAPVPKEPELRSIENKVDELIELARSTSRRVQTPAALMPPDYFYSVLGPLMNQHGPNIVGTDGRIYSPTGAVIYPSNVSVTGGGGAIAVGPSSGGGGAGFYYRPGVGIVATGGGAMGGGGIAGGGSAGGGGGGSGGGGSGSGGGGGGGGGRGNDGPGGGIV